MELDTQTLEQLVKNRPLKERVDLTVEQVVWVEQLKLLRSINGKLNFFLFLALVSILVALLR